MADRMRCPACHLRLRPTLKLLVERAKLEQREKSGTDLGDGPGPAGHAASFPCRRCGTQIENRGLVLGHFDERQPRWVILEAPLVGVAVAGLFGWLYAWGPIAGTIMGIIAAAVSVTMLVPLHHYFTENRMLRERGLPPSQTDWSEAIAFIFTVLVMPGIATFLYGSMGWIGLIGTSATGIALLAYLCFRGKERDNEATDDDIAQRELG